MYDWESYGNLLGQPYCLINGDYTEHNFPNEYANDKIASFECGKNVLARFCVDGTDRECRYGQGESSAGHIRQSLMGDPDRTTSIKMWPYDYNVRPAAVLFDGANCTRRSGVFFAPAEVGQMKIGYNKEDMWKNNIGKNMVYSAAIPYGVSVRFFEHDGFRGDSEVVEGNFFEEINTLQPSCQNLPSGWGDRQGSIEVFKTGSLGQSRGFWRGVTASEEINFMV